MHTGDSHSAVVTALGDVWCWGLGGMGQLGNGSRADSSVPVLVQGMHGRSVAAVAAGSFQTLAITDAGLVYQW